MNSRYPPWLPPANPSILTVNSELSIIQSASFPLSALAWGSEVAPHVFIEGLPLAVHTAIDLVVF